MKHMTFIVTIIVFLHTAMLSVPVSAEEYTCTIKNTLKINLNGNFVKHGWAANYMNRQFTVDSESGQVLRTTALKQRLSNSDNNHKPVLLSAGKPDMPMIIFTHYGETGRYALLQIHDSNEFSNSERKPFFYHTDVGMILTGTCILQGQ